MLNVCLVPLQELPCISNDVFSQACQAQGLQELHAQLTAYQADQRRGGSEKATSERARQELLEVGRWAPPNCLVVALPVLIVQSCLCELQEKMSLTIAVLTINCGIAGMLENFACLHLS